MAERISIDALIGELASLDVKLRVERGQLRVNAPRGVLTDALRSTLAERKSDLLEFLEASARPNSDVHALGRASRADPIPLSHGQQRIWSLAEMRPESGVYNTSTIYRLTGALDVAALEQSLNELQQRHEILRTTFPADHHEPRQLISPAVPVILPVTNIAKDLKRLPESRREPEILRLLRTEVQRPFDIKREPPWRSLLLRLREKEHILALTIHHIIFDGGSDAIWLRELSLFYRALVAGQPPSIDALPLQYADFACWERERLRGDVGERQLAYWRKQLDGAVNELRLPTDRARSVDATFRGASETFELPDALTRALVALCRREQAGSFATLLAAYCATLHGYTSQDDLVVCSPFAARERAELEGLIGYFNNIVVMRADLSADPSFRELVARVRRSSVEASDNQTLPLQRIAELPNLVRVPLTRGMFCYQDLSNRNLELPGITASSIDIRKETADFDLAMYLQTEKGKLTGVLEYDAELFDVDTIHGFVRDFQTVLESVTTDPDRRLSQLPRFGPQLAGVESLLNRHTQIDEAVVVDLPDHSGSVAYLVLNEYDTPSLDDVRQLVKAEIPEYLVPLAFVPLDQMPLTADGRVDRPALPQPIITKGRPANVYIAPRTDLEKRLAAIWRVVLWLDQDVGVRDRFSDLGGHSLLAVQLLMELEKELHRTVPASVLSRLNTIEEMATVLEQAENDDATEARPGASPAPSEVSPEIYRGLLTYTASWLGERVAPESLVVGLNVEGTKEPLFWCLQRYGELIQLAKYLGAEQPVYAMRSGNRVMVKTQANIDTLAAHYVGEILAVKPEGPFFLGGNCQAAEISFQIAKGLEERGHEVSLLIMLEKFIPQEYSGRVAMLFGAKSDRSPYQHYQEPEIGWRKFYTGGHSVDLVPGNHARFFREPNIQVLAQTIRTRLEEAQRESAPAVPQQDHGLQQLSHAAYRAQLTADRSRAAAPGEEIRIRVAVRNTSAETWRSGDVSGIALANRWLNAKEEVVKSRDGRARLVADLPPGATVELELTVRAPKKKGRWILELDMIDEGITWFGDRGSQRTRLQVDVGRNSRVRRGFRTLLQGLASKG